MSSAKSFTHNIGVVVNISLTELTAHPIFCLQLCHQLGRFGDVTLYIPRRGTIPDRQKLETQLGFSINFTIDQVDETILGKKSLRFFYYLAVVKLWLHRKTLLWSFEPYSVRLASLLGIKSVVEIHSSLPPKRYIKAAKIIQGAPSFKLFIANSKAHSALLSSHGLSTRKIVGAHNAITEDFARKVIAVTDIEKKEFWKNSNVSGEAVITYAGSLYKGRGVEAMIEAAPFFPQFAFVILGGPESQRVLFERSKKSSNVYFLGSISHQNVPSFLAASDILIALYNSDCEDIGGNKTILTASPMKLFEYMASGVPLISSNIGAIPEIIENGKSGILIDPDNLLSFRQAIAKLMENKAWALGLALAAAERVRQFTWSKRLDGVFARFERD